jgi:hypothetical protein
MTSNTNSTKPEKAPDLLKLLLTELAQEGIKAKARWAPTKKYVTLLLGSDSFAYIEKQTKNGVMVKPRLKKAPKGVKGLKPDKWGGPNFTVKGLYQEANLAQAVMALQAAASLVKEEQAQAKAQKAEKAAAARKAKRAAAKK